LVSLSSAAYTNWDAQLEFEAAQNVLSHGVPVISTGFLINQPPLGFYLDASALALFGLSYEVGLALMALFSLGSVAAMYGLGRLFYGKTAGLVAAALFGIVPWHVYMSRIFLIDNQYLFFSLLCLLFGALAIRRNSDRLVLFAGVFFGLALLTKVFAVFVLVPLALLVFFGRGKFRLTRRRALVFCLPTLATQLVWYGVFEQQNFLGVYFSTDFTHPVHIADPNLLFLPRLLVWSDGWLLVAAAFFSVALSLVFWRLLAGLRRLDAVWVATTLVVFGLDAALVLGPHLLSPYIGAFKYTYFTVPFFCLLAASLVKKGSVLIASVDPKAAWDRLKWVLAGCGAALIFASLVECTDFLSKWVGFIAFEVDSNGNYYSLELYASGLQNSMLQTAHIAATAIILLTITLPPIAMALKNRLNRQK
jgi:4-amino-4-deoxy-L-arabinose transferase-like glycosyltransferase